MMDTKRGALAIAALAAAAAFGGSAAPAEAKCVPVHGVNPCIVVSVVCAASGKVDDKVEPIVPKAGEVLPRCAV